jgi:spermidine synthase
MNSFTRRVLFALFFVSGFCSLVYQVVWTRMAFASFGIILPVLSVVLSVFMLGLAVGSWAGGRWIGPLTKRSGVSAVFFYAAAELVIGLSAFGVPKLFAAGEQLLLTSGQTDSFRYLALSALGLAGAILPWCICMGTTYPLMLAFIRERERGETSGFSFLYLANALGAMSGTLLAAVVWIEVLGFHHTLWLAAAGNFAIAFISVCLGWEQRAGGAAGYMGGDAAAQIAISVPPDAAQNGLLKWILFSTGFLAMAMEVVWTRAFTPVLKTQVYSFAAIVFVYLGATILGSWRYRRDLHAQRQISLAVLMAALAGAVYLPVVLDDFRIMVAAGTRLTQTNLRSAILLLASIGPFCAGLGYLTPGLIDEYAGGDPGRAGRAYAINVLGCILGPLFACYFLLPHLSERFSLLLLSLPLLVFCLRLRHRLSRPRQLTLAPVLTLLLGWCIFGTEDFEARLRKIAPEMVVRRDYAANVISYGSGPGRALLVNGIGMTTLTPATKFMVHLPLACHTGPPKSVLVICFGMGTTYRSAMSWNIDTTAVELVPSVVQAFGFYHADAARFLSATNGRIIIDDGRRFLKRAGEKFDVIVVDPPPPVEAAGSSLLFSREFYELAKQHLNPGGVIQMWYPGSDDLATSHAVLRSFYESFPYARSLPSVEGGGVHLLGSLEPLEKPDAEKLAARMPESARQDLVEWNAIKDARAYLASICDKEFDPATLLYPDRSIEVTDDRPYNEYFLLRLRFNREPH